MIALDTNVLVYAEMNESQYHRRARQILTELAEGAVSWSIPWPCIYETLRVVTHPRVFRVPLSTEVAMQDIQRILASPSLNLLSETDLHAAILQRVVRESAAKGNLMHDAHIATLCFEHGVAELITGDRDFARFPGLRTINPFLS
ncbi:MAG: PIN domain-containing protein [Acidobacteria bacterium]|nr:PIN domain-containing protein [Acidobacteriota bacterium]